MPVLALLFTSEYNHSRQRPKTILKSRLTWIPLETQSQRWKPQTLDVSQSDSDNSMRFVNDFTALLYENYTWVISRNRKAKARHYNFPVNRFTQKSLTIQYNKLNWTGSLTCCSFQAGSVRRKSFLVICKLYFVQHQTLTHIMSHWGCGWFQVKVWLMQKKCMPVVITCLPRDRWEAGPSNLIGWDSTFTIWDYFLVQ